MESGDPRPSIAIGHVTLRVADVAGAAGFYTELGLRLVMENPSLAILELRGGTHLMLFKAKRAPRVGAVRSFDFMVDEVKTLRTRLAKSGVERPNLPTTRCPDTGGSRRATRTGIC